MIVDCVGLMKTIKNGKLKTGTKITVHTPNYDTDYWFWGNWFGEADGYSKKMDNIELYLCDKDCMFEFISEEDKDKEIDIQSLQGIDLYHGLNASEDQNIITNRLKINEIVRALKQLDKEIKNGRY